MRYMVELLGERYEVEVREGAGGLEAGLVPQEGEAKGKPTCAPASLSPAPAPLYTLAFGEQRLSLSVEDDPLEPGGLNLRHAGSLPLPTRVQDARTLSAGQARSANAAQGPKVQRSAMPGAIVEVRVEAGQEVEAGQLLLVLEAMKMQNEIKAQRAGTLAEVHVQAGQSVPAGQPLVTFAAPAEDAS